VFRVLVALTSVLLSAQGAFELEVRDQPFGMLLIGVAVLVAGLGAAADPYVRHRGGR
jgi:hypothetical protein